MSSDFKVPFAAISTITRRDQYRCCDKPKHRSYISSQMHFTKSNRSHFAIMANESAIRTRLFFQGRPNRSGLSPTRTAKDVARNRLTIAHGVLRLNCRLKTCDSELFFVLSSFLLLLRPSLSSLLTFSSALIVHCCSCCCCCCGLFLPLDRQ